jgi:tetratricopeptide (TPR) repeat protein
VLVWQPYPQTYQEVVGTRRFVSREACEKGRANAAKESQSVADYMKASKADTSMQANRLGDCHCDRTTDPSSGVFLDTKARMNQLRVEQESAWTIRERLLGSELPTAGEYIRLLFGREPRLDRIFRETVPERLPQIAVRPPSGALRDTKKGGQSEPPPTNLTLAAIPPSGSGATLPTSTTGVTLALDAVSTSSDPHEEFATAAEFGRRFFEAGNFAASLTWFEKADSLVRDQPTVLYNTALVLVKLQRYDDAQRRIERCIALSPPANELQAVKALQLEVKFLIEFGRVKVEEDKYKTLFSRAKSLYEKSQRREALEAFRQAEQIYSDDPALYWNDGVIYEEDGAFEDARRSYNRYLQLDPSAGPQLQSHIIDLDREIGDMRTKLMCPICGAKLAAGARWCHHCWHGPYDVTNAAWNARACDLHAVVTRALQDVNGKTRISEPQSCLFGSRSLHDFLQYSPAIQTAARDARTAEGWSFTEGLLQSRRSAAGDELTMRQGEYLQAVVSLPIGEVFAYKGHKTGDGIWLLDAQPYSTGDQLFFVMRSFDTDGRVLREEVSYDSTVWRHAVSYVATYTYDGELLVGAQIKGGYDGYRVEGMPQVRWEAAMTRKFDSNARLLREELAVTSFQKTYMAKPQGKISDEVRRVYQNLKTHRPIDIRATGDVCGAAAPHIDEAIDLRPLFVVSPAIAVRLSPGDARLVVDYAYAEK